MGLTRKALAVFSPGFVAAVWFWPSSLHRMKRLTASLALALAVVASAPGGLALAQPTQEQIETAMDWLESDIIVAYENRCAPYDPKDYSYSSRELKDALIADREGRIVSYYTGETFTSLDEADLDHIVALSEAHDSGACAWSSQQRKDFTNYIYNHELASPRLNREEKQGKDWAEWQPPLNGTNPATARWCFFAMQIVVTKWRYGLTVDPVEYDALAATLAHCLDRFAEPGTAPAAGWD